MTVRFDQVPIQFMSRPPARIRRLRWSRRRALACTAAAAALSWWGLVEAVAWVLP